MFTNRWSWLSIAACTLVVGLAVFSTSSGAPVGESDLRGQINEAFRQGNFNDAYAGFRKLVLDPHDAPAQVGGDLKMAVQCLQRLNRTDEIDALLEDAITIHNANWRLLWLAAETYTGLDHRGFIVAGKFYRGSHRGAGKTVNAVERDRIRALQLMVEAMPLAMKDDNHGEVGNYLLGLANILSNGRGGTGSWRLQYLSDLAVLPDYEVGWGYSPQTSGSPVDADGKPIFYRVPKSFEAAENDGQRWRWCLQQAVEFNPQQLNAVRVQFADFLAKQFGVETMAQWGRSFGRMETDDTKADESGTYALHTLGENETIARLATGIKRLELPDEFNFIKIYQQVAAEPKTGYAEKALGQLAANFREPPPVSQVGRVLAPAAEGLSQ